jgi:dihydroneopterin aldolase
MTGTPTGTSVCQNEGNMVEVFVRGLDFYGHHGVTDEEQAIGHRYLANVTAVLDDTVLHTDDITDTVDYANLAMVMLQVSSESRFRTVESLAAAYCQKALKVFPPIMEIEVEIAKQMPPAPIIAEATGVRFQLRRRAEPREPDPGDIV